VLREVAVVAAEDTRRTARLLQHYSISTPTTSLHEHNERRKAPLLIGRLKAGQNVALVSDAGTPTVSDPGAHLIERAIAEGIKVEPIPGPSAVMAALVVSGLPTDEFVFVGFPPPRASDRSRWLRLLSTERRTFVLFEAPHRIQTTLAEMARVLGDRPIMMARELTKVHEQLVRGPISDVFRAVGNPRGEYTLVVAGAVSQPEPEPEPPSAQQIRSEIGLMIESGAVSRRKALAILARKYGLRPNAVYRLLEEAK
jgi:16S rRNA (cytidine1402-2'-O)-methyltransferase